jgi:hypothetical protein
LILVLQFPGKTQGVLDPVGAELGAEACLDVPDAGAGLAFGQGTEFPEYRVEGVSWNPGQDEPLA